MSVVSPPASSTHAPAGAVRRARASAAAARYGVLRRLAPALKHDMVVHLQAVAMMAEVLGAKLERGTPSPSDLENSISKMNRLARQAVMNCLKVTAWIEPGEDDAVLLHEGVRECLGLLQGSFNFRGISVTNETPAAEFEVSRGGLLNLLCASLITLTDDVEGAADVKLQGELAAGWAVLTLQCEAHAPDADSPAWEPPAAPLDWADVQALAVAESIELIRNARQIVLRIPRKAGAPLKIVPN